MSDVISYQLHIQIHQSLRLRIGALGEFTFPAGHYRYTGSATRNMDARIARHCRRDKPLRWHIDYLTVRPEVDVEQVARSDREECEWNQASAGDIIVPGFGSSDCRAGCGSHLKFLGPVHV